MLPLATTGEKALYQRKKRREKYESSNSSAEEKKLVNVYARTSDDNEYERNGAPYGTSLQPISSKPVFPPAPFPRKYVHCVIGDLDYLVQAVHALQADGHDVAHIHVMVCWDYVRAVETRERQRNTLSKILHRFLSLLDDTSGDIYLQEALQGNHVLMVRLSGYEQTKCVRDMLLLHNAHHIRYVDTWTVCELS